MNTAKNVGSKTLDNAKIFSTDRDIFMAGLGIIYNHSSNMVCFWYSNLFPLLQKKTSWQETAQIL